MSRDISRDIKQTVRQLLWGKAAGRCSMPGCNIILYRSKTSLRTINLSQHAHIVAFSQLGPRGTEDIPDEEINDIDNLILLCPQCHIEIDTFDDDFDVEIVRQIKEVHESKIEYLSGLNTKQTSVIVTYYVKVGEAEPFAKVDHLAKCLFPESIPAFPKPIDLGTTDSAILDHKRNFFQFQASQLETKFTRKLRPLIDERDVDHISLFALAAQPLLMKLGVLLTDIVPVAVYQRHRATQSWCWPDYAEDVAFELHEPVDKETTNVCLVIALSATITEARVTDILGLDCSIWTLTTASPNQELIKAREHLAQFNRVFRRALDQIKSTHGENTTLHIFPAVPNSIAVEIGRCRQPKADLDWSIYEQSKRSGRFVEALAINSK